MHMQYNLKKLSHLITHIEERNGLPIFGNILIPFPPAE